MEVTSRNGGGVDGTGASSEGSVIIVCRDAISGLEVDEFRDVLVPVKGIEEFVIAGVGDHKERARGHGFSRVPNEEIYLRVVIQCIKFLHTEIVVVDKLMMRNRFTIHLFLVEDAAAHTVKTIKRLNHRQI